MDTRPKSRSHLAAYLSDDDGVTWQGGLVLDEREGVSYPDGAIAPDGTLYVTYDRNRDTDGEVLLARFTEADVLAGRLVSSGSALRLLVSRPNPTAVAARHAERKKDALRRLIGNADLRFIHIPQWRAWNGVGVIEMSKLNMNNGGALPALANPLPPETRPDDAHSWQNLAPAITGFVSFASIAAPREGQVGYARAYVHSTAERPAVFLLGADYWMQFRVNGRTLIDHAREIRPSWSPDLHEFRADAVLRSGWNLLEIKVASGQGGFAFACQIDDTADLLFEVVRPAD